MLKDKWKHLGHLHLIIFIWGFTAILGKIITLEALDLVWGRIGIAITSIYIYAKIRRKSLRIPRKNMLLFLLSGIIIALHWYTFFYAIKISNVSITLAGISTGAFFASWLEPLLLRRKIIAYEVVLGLIVVGGLAIIFSVEQQYTLGIVVALISAFLSAFFSIINALYIKKQDALNISFYELSGGFLFLTAILFVQQDISLEQWAHQWTSIGALDWASLLILGIICTAYPFISTVNLMQYITPYTMMLSINLEPVYGIILAYFIFPETEKMSPNFYIGAGVVLSTILLNAYLKNRASRKFKE